MGVKVFVKLKLRNFNIMTFGSRLKELRGKQSRKDFAELVGSHENTIGNYERDTRTPDISFVSNVCKITGVSLDWLVRGEAIEQAQPNQGASCLRCERLENDNRELMIALSKERDMSRELMTENRELMRENGDLRVELAEIRARSEQPNESSRKAS